jgi:hypothetical protein
MVNRDVHTVAQLVSAFDGDLAAWAGIGETAVANWVARDFIPPGWHLRLYIEACRRGLTLDLESLFGLSAPEAEFLRTSARHQSRRGDQRPRASVN